MRSIRAIDSIAGIEMRVSKSNMLLRIKRLRLAESLVAIVIIFKATAALISMIGALIRYHIAIFVGSPFISCTEEQSAKKANKAEGLNPNSSGESTLNRVDCA
jgi:hypothetical protein